MNTNGSKAWFLPAALALAACLGCEASQSGSPAAAQRDRSAPPPIEPAPVMVQEKATVGLTKKGQAAADYKPGILTTPAREYLRVPDRIAFEIQIPHAMNLYKGEHGEFPKSHERFMQDIIAANQIKLPELPDGSKYVYDPEKGELMIEHTQ